MKGGKYSLLKGKEIFIAKRKGDKINNTSIVTSGLYKSNKVGESSIKELFI